MKFRGDWMKSMEQKETATVLATKDFWYESDLSGFLVVENYS